MESKNVVLKTEDDYVIKATHYPNSGKAIILLHRLNQTRSSWENFPEKLQEEGYDVLSLDLRGHGQSQGKWQNFNEKNFNDMIFDIKSAKKYLNIKEYAIIGESIGANLAIIMGSKDKEVTAVVSLSPGFNYKGLNAKSAIANYHNPILIVASKEDTQSYEPSKTMYDIAAGIKEFKEYNYAGHGTQMFAKTNLEEEIIEWLASNYL